MASSLGIWLLLSVYTRIALAQTLAYWYSPPNAGATSNYDENPTLTIGEVFELRWTTVIDSYQIVLWQQNLDIETSMYGSAVYIKQDGAPETGRYNWTVTPQAFDVSASNVFYLALTEYDDTRWTSHYFNLTEAAATVSSTSSATRTSTAVTTKSSPHPTFRPPAIPAASASTPADAGGTGATTAKLSLGLGLGLGIPLLLTILGIAFYIWRTRRRRRKPTPSHPPSYASMEAQPRYSEAPKEAPTRDTMFAHEMSPESRPAELPGRGER